MYFTKPWFESASYVKRFRRMEPKKWFFKEVIPLCSTNEVKQKVVKPAEGACIEELNAFFACLRKWEFDDLRCVNDHDAYMRCVTKHEERMDKFRRSLKDENYVSSGGQVSVARLNSLLKQWPQPNMGMPPYRKMKRLPNQSYAEDIFHRQNVPGKKS